ncbi:N-6 DNA methylase [Streptomyces sp. NPDC001523]|uniref:N-6 DNA methylase n=1 Tax=Streptomyces sp. NPDC001523 TaxID=3154383 RepID=UPI00331A278A
MSLQLDLFASAAPEPAPAPAPFTATAPRVTRPEAASIIAPPRESDHRPRPARSHDLHSKAFALGEAVTDAWHRAHGGSDIAVPIGLVAALALIRQRDAAGPSLEAQILGLDGVELIEMYRQIWAQHWAHRPDLIDRARVLHEWLNDTKAPDKDRVYAVKCVTRAALKGGILDLTGHPVPYERAQTDVLSHVMMLLRSSSARQGLGEFHTPPPVADMLAEVTLTAQWALEDPRAGQHIHDPAGGSGGLLRAAAQTLRHRGFDPADFQWSMVDVDQIAAACGAVNMIVWGMGRRVTVACDNTLSNARAVEDAMAHARAVIAHRDEVLGKARIIAALNRTQALVEQIAA